MKSSRSKLAAAAVGISCLLVVSVYAVSGGTPCPEDKSGLEGLSWLAGQWRSEKDGVISEEHWSAPAGDCIMGMFRQIKAGSMQFAELILIQQEGDCAVMRLKHFGPGLRDLDGGRSYEFRLTRAGDSEAVFEHPEESFQGHRRLLYRREGGIMHVRIEDDREGRDTITFQLELLDQG
ncbi:MAG: hypothetical protein JSU68_14510 [Phycisphaerales bacterium]|nr:MAG: hypothetical protein JSU68_14510 [Phycisphaerales bacterium]